MMEQTQISPEVRLLIVDDEPNIRSALGLALRLMGYLVDEAGSGEEALLMLEHLPYDLMVLDMRMPGLHGIDVMNRARQLCPELLIVILTGHATLESAIAAVKSEAVDYLLKPVSTHEIGETVTRDVKNQSWKRHRQQQVQILGEALEVLGHTEPATSVGSVSNDTAVGAPLQFASLILDRQKRMLTIDGPESQTLHLTEGETLVLASLMMYTDQVLSCSDLIQAGWGYEMNEQEAQGVIRPHICRLRRKIGEVMARPILIHTVRKRGYVLSSNKK
jgi:DNA-binding response OmpR family regulator